MTSVCPRHVTLAQRRASPSLAPKHILIHHQHDRISGNTAQSGLPRHDFTVIAVGSAVSSLWVAVAALAAGSDAGRPCVHAIFGSKRSE